MSGSEEKHEVAEKTENQESGDFSLKVCDSIVEDNFGEKIDVEMAVEPAAEKATDSSSLASMNILANFFQHFERANSGEKKQSKERKVDTKDEIMDSIENDNFDSNPPDTADSGEAYDPINEPALLESCAKSQLDSEAVVLKNAPSVKEIESAIVDPKPEAVVSETPIPADRISEENTMETDAESQEDDEKNEVIAYIAATKQRIAAKLEIRTRNKNAVRPDEQSLAKLDSSLKKNTAFVKKVRHFTAAQLDNLLKEMYALNLSKYLSEVASALIETKLKMSDIEAAVMLCTEINCRYAEFGKCMLEFWQKTLAQKKDEKVTNFSKFRVDLRFYADLISSGVFSCKEALPLLGNVLTVLTASSHDDSSHISIIVSFCKYCGEDYAGLIPRRIRLLAKKFNLEVPKSDLIPPEKQKTVQMLLKDYYSNLKKYVLKEYAEFQKVECQNRKILQTKGELSNEKREKSEVLHCNLQKLLASMASLAELVDEEVFTLPENKQTAVESSTCIIAPVSKNDGLDKYSSIWEDEETQKFYED